MDDVIVSEVYDLTGSGVAIWAGTWGYLAALLDEHLNLIPGSTNWDYAPTVHDALVKVLEEARKRERKAKK